MSEKPLNRCLACGQPIEIDPLAETILYEVPFADIPQNARSFCLKCEAKIIREAQDAQLTPKPM
ncbi:MAG: hypothetical protein GX989_08840 [Firmicutes bacterium]|jgi:hypothetical protein|nr:hypothetical protein [Bacillota bacterium]